MHSSRTVLNFITVHFLRHYSTATLQANIVLCTTDIYEVSHLPQVTAKRFKSECPDLIKRSNRSVKYVKQQKVSISFPQLDQSTLRTAGSSDASLSSNYDMTSQLGYIILLADATGACFPLQFRCYKPHRVVRSALPEQLIAFAEMVDAAYTLAEEPRSMHPVSDVHLKLYTDNKSLFDVTSKGSRTSEKRLMVNIDAAREGCRKMEIWDIGFVKTPHNFADGITK